MFCYPGFDQSPPGRIVVISGREGPDTVEMVGQDHHCIDHKRAIGVDVAKGLAHELNGPLIAEQRSSSCGDDGEEVSATGYERSSILHGVGLDNVGLRCANPTYSKDLLFLARFQAAAGDVAIGPQVIDKGA